MMKIIKSKTIESDYFGILAFITGGIAFIPWYYWIGRTTNEIGAKRLGRGAILLASIMIVFLIVAYFIGFFIGANRASNEAFLNISFNLLALGVLAFYFGWNETFRRRWNQIDTVARDEELKAGPIWTVLFGPIYLNFKINQARGTER